MRNPIEQGQRWLKQAQHDFCVAQKHLADKDYSDACYMSEQSAQKALKAYLLVRGERFVPIHSVAELVSQCADKDGDFEPLKTAGKILDQFYIPTRYPDALASPAVPFEIYTEEQAQQAIAFAKEIVQMVERKVSAVSRRETDKPAV